MMESEKKPLITTYMLSGNLGYLQFCPNIKHLKFLRYRNTISPIHQFYEIK